MNRSQKIIIVGPFFLLAAILHTFFCDWKSGVEFTGNSDFTGGRPRSFLSFGSNAGIVGRSRSSMVTDLFCGIVAPIVLVASALYIFVSPALKDAT